MTAARFSTKEQAQNEWRPPYNPNTDPTLEFVGYEDDQPVWRKRPQHTVVVDGVAYAPVG